MSFQLTPAEIGSSLWTKLKAHIEERIAGHRRTNDGNLNTEDTAKVRGRIAEGKYILSLDGDLVFKKAILLGLNNPAPQMDAGDS